MTNQKEPNIGVSFQARIKYKGGMVRGFRENTNTYFVYKPYSRTKGHRYTKAEFDKKYQIIPQTQLWHKDLTRALNKIYKTGLWTNLSDIFENLLKMEWDDYQIIKQKSFNKNEKENLYQKYHEQYPFLFDDTHQIRMEYCNEVSECKLKTMYFGWDNKPAKQRIKQAIATKQPYSQSIDVNYHVRYDYDPFRNKAWYSEEYKNCGNGHYYLALDEHTAIFCEDD